MKYRAKTSFAGEVSKSEGEIFEIENEYIEKDLLNAGYIEKVQDKDKITKKKVQTNED